MTGYVDTFRRAVLGWLAPAGRRARLVILTFHQVPRDPDPLFPGVAHASVFRKQMQWLADFCTVMPLSEAAVRLAAGTLPARAACVTFDDGYLDNFEVAAPVLQQLGLAATFFITAGAVEEGIMWNDLVIEGLRRCDGSVDLNALELGLGTYRLTDVGSRRAAIETLLGRLKYQPRNRRLELARAIFSCSTGTVEPRLMMHAENVKALAHAGFDIGAHTMTHPILRQLDPDEARREIEQSRGWVRDVTGTWPVAFAYPNGRPEIDFTSEHEEMVRVAGFTTAVSTRWASATGKDSLFSLPRFAPWERDRDRFWSRLVKTHMQGYLDGLR